MLAARSRHCRNAGLAAWGSLSLLANAFICDALSNPHDRRGARRLARDFAVMLAVMWVYERRAVAGAPAPVLGRPAF
jgi:hypothetical protein